jgi:arylsulfatase A-like enzyme
MNRQTVGVLIGTLVVVLLGTLLLYATPGPRAPKPEPVGVAEGAPEPAKITKAKSAKATKGGAPRTVDEAALVHRAAVPADRPAAPAGAPNVVLVLASTQRRDQWSMYGGPDLTTPFLAARAKEGVVMADALSVAVDPRPAMTAVLTGSYPHRVGVVQRGPDGEQVPLAPEAVTLAERLAAAGWSTVGATSMQAMNRRLGGDQGFDWYRDSQPYGLMLDQRVDASTLVAKALEAVASRTPADAARPLYLQLVFVDSHKPFKVPPDEFAPFEGPDHQIAPYRATIRRVDAAVEKLVEGLATHGVTRDNTVFVVLADHGEGLDMPVHHRKQHGFVLYGSAVRIPWIWWGKGVARGRTAEGLASQVDLVPTVLSLAGLPPAPEPLDGIDLSAVVRGEASSTTRTEAYSDTLLEGADRASLWTSTTQCQKDYGSVLGPDDAGIPDGCFDRKADPDFTKVSTDAALLAALDARHAELVGLLPAPEPTHERDG